MAVASTCTIGWRSDNYTNTSGMCRGEIRSNSMSDQTKPAFKMLRNKALQAKLGIGGSTIHDRNNPKALGYDPTFPKPIKLGTGKAVGWIEAEIDQWIIQQIDKRNHELAITKK